MTGATGGADARRSGYLVASVLALVAILVAGLWAWANLDWLAGPGARHFDTAAVYRSRAHGYVLRIDASGLIASGSDVSDEWSGTVTIAPGDSGAPGRVAELVFEGDPGVRYRVGDGPWKRLDWDWRSASSSLATVLGQAGLAPSLGPAAQDEAVAIIDGAFAGPKGTRLAGQVTHHDVESVQFVR